MSNLESKIVEIAKEVSPARSYVKEDFFGYIFQLESGWNDFDVKVFSNEDKFRQRLEENNLCFTETKQVDYGKESVLFTVYRDEERKKYYTEHWLPSYRQKKQWGKSDFFDHS